MARDLLFDSSYRSCRNNRYVKVPRFPPNEGVRTLRTSGRRIYAVTEKNKWVGGALSSLIATQVILGSYIRKGGIELFVDYLTLFRLFRDYLI